jgi:hypothetical protein
LSLDVAEIENPRFNDASDIRRLTIVVLPDPEGAAITISFPVPIKEY